MGAVWRARVLTPEGPDTVRWLDDARVEIDDEGRFGEVGPWTGGPCDRDLRPDVLTPGFVDGHVHGVQLRILGSASGPLLEWLDKSTFPAEARFADPAYARTEADRFAAALAAVGTTTALVYGSVHAHAADALLEAMDRRGLRGRVGPVLMDEHAPSELLRPAELALPDLEALAERWAGHRRLEVAVVPRFALSCSRALMEGAGDLARRHGLWVSTHLAENPDECAEARRRFDADDYLSIYEGAGLVHERSVFAHCIHLSDDAWRRLADADAVVAHCPDSNAFLGSGDMPIGRPLDGGVPIVLGSDVGAGRTLQMMRIASAAYDAGLRTGHGISAARCLWLGTRGGALALGYGKVGGVEEGLVADGVVHRVPEWVEDVLGYVVFGESRVVETIVAGETVWSWDDRDRLIEP